MPIAILLLNLLPGLIKGIPGISSKIQQIIADVSGSASVILASGAVTQPGVNTILAAWAGVISVLKADPNLPASSLNAVAQLEKAVAAMLTEDAVAAQQVDWTKIITISTV
jgi:hypothetical protein